MQIVKRERGEYVLRAGGDDIGQLREGVVWFHAFADEATAREAGAAACGVLAEWHRERAGMGRRTSVTSLRAPETIPVDARLLLGDAVVGRVSRRHDPMGVALFDIELALPGSLLHAVATHLIDRLYAAVAASRAAGASGAPDARAVDPSN
jgi:hypothetical protein